MQDKIHVNDKWDVTPALRYSHYNSFSGTRQAKRDSSGKIVKMVPAMSFMLILNIVEMSAHLLL